MKTHPKRFSFVHQDKELVNNRSKLFWSMITLHLWSMKPF